MNTALIARIQNLYVEYGGMHYDGSRREPVTALQHSLQCAYLAEQAGADAALVAASFLHDIGHFGATEDEATDDAHELKALPMLTPGFGPAVLEPVRLHVQAKRYLASVDAAYAAALSPASVHSLALQGGPMNEAERKAFDALPHAQDALRLRRWDDLAKDPAMVTPGLDYYTALLEEVARA